MGRWRWMAIGLLAGVAAWAQAPAVDRTKPEAVAQAYLNAVQRSDLVAVREFSAREKNLDTFLTLFVGQMTRGPEGQLLSEVGLAELALFPMPKSTLMAVPAPATAGADKVTYDLTKTVTLQPKLVLAKQADGTWLVDLAASLQATAPDGKSVIMSIAKMMDAVPEGALAEPEDAQPWQCMSKLRELAQALRSYAEEHRDKLPAAATWYDELLPYLEDPKAMVCPDHDDEEFSYAFNAELGGTELNNDWEHQRRTVTLACVKGDAANMTFTPNRLDALRGRHGKTIIYATATGEAMVLPDDWTFERATRDQEQSDACSERMRNLAKALKEYAAGHDGKLPPADGWLEALRPLVAKPRDGGSPFVCPAAANAALISYAYSPALAGKRLAGMVNLRKVLAFAEIEGSEGAPLVADKASGPTRHHCAWGQVRRAGFWYQAMLDGSTSTQSPPAPGAPAAHGQ
ncbi:MAG: hypothetical protein HZB16_14765 [Armatimonadetes bacterium]|nr:hypothetical protein [Armatimonadota bacterium]